MSDEHVLLADVIRWLLGLPADQVTWRHAVFLTLGGTIWLGPGLFRVLHHRHHVRFIERATPEQLAAYTGKPLPPPKPPSIGGPLVMLAILLALAITGRQEERSAEQLDSEQTLPVSAVRNCCKDCDPPSRCNRCKCEAQTVKPPRVQPQRDERFTSAPTPPLQSYDARFSPVYQERWRRYLPES